MTWIYLSPHLDDAVFSCGGTIWEQTRKDKPVEVWTLFAGNPPLAPLSPYAETLHHRWQTGPDAPAVRREEDRIACALVQAQPRTFDFPDCIYRSHPDTGEWTIQQDADLFTPVQPAETHLLEVWVKMAARTIPTDDCLAIPLGLGGHRDHRLTCLAAWQLAALRPDLELYFYADFPYVLRNRALDRPEDWIPAVHELDALKPVGESISEPGLSAWQAAAAAYRSQISSFWTDQDDLASDLRRYWEDGGGQLFRRSHHQPLPILHPSHTGKP